MSRGMRPGWRHSVQVVAASTTLLVVAGGLTACGDKDPGPATTVTHPVTASATPTPTPTPTPTLAPEQIPPTPPAALTDVGADGATKDEAIQVAEYFMQLNPYIWSTNDLAAWNALSHPECEFCSNSAEGVLAQSESDETTSGGLVTLSEVVVTEGDTGRLFLVEGFLNQAETEIHDANGTLMASESPPRYVFHVAVLFETGTWSVREVSFD